MATTERHPEHDIAVGILPDGRESAWTSKGGCLTGKELGQLVMLCLKPTPVEVRIIKAGSLDQPYEAISS